MSYQKIYNKRINRYGTNKQSRLENGRRANFERFLSSSPHRLEFEYNEQTIECVFKPYKQDETKTLMHVLVRADQNFNIGDIVEIDNRKFMFYYLDERRNSGYNRYTVAKTNQTINWITPEKNSYTSWGYAYFQEDNMLANELKSRSRMDTLYLENLKKNFILMPVNKEMKDGSYVTITTCDIEQNFFVTGFDIISTPGVMYVTINPTFKRDMTPPPEQKSGESDSDFFWIRGGNLDE